MADQKPNQQKPQARPGAPNSPNPAPPTTPVRNEIGQVVVPAKVEQATSFTPTLKGADTTSSSQEKGTVSPRAPLSWIEQAEKHLLDHGWERQGETPYGQSMWSDPHGKDVQPPNIDEKGFVHPNAVPVIQSYPVKGGGTETIRQWSVPPVKWNYTTEQAMRIQRARELAGEDLASTIKRKRLELEKLEYTLKQREEEQEAREFEEMEAAHKARLQTA